MSRDEQIGREIDRRERSWRRELERTSRRRRSDYDRQQRDAGWKLDRQRDDARREIERTMEEQRRQSPTSGLDLRALLDEDWRIRRWLGFSSESVMRFIGAGLAVFGTLPLVAGHLAAYTFNGGWPRYRLGESLSILWRLPGSLGDPGGAWDPVNTGAPVPGPAAWWSTFAVLAGFAALMGIVAYAVNRPTDRRGNGDQGPPGEDGHWAGGSEVRRLQVSPTDESRLVVGTSGSRRLALLDRHSLLVIGPAHAGKTRGLTIPALLEWRGPAVVASSKGDLVDRTIGWRSHLGDVHVFDPAAVSPYRRSGWSPLAGCTTWADAIRTAQDLTAAAMGAVGVTADGRDLIGEGRGELWRSSMAMTLAPFLFAAAVSGRSIVEAVEWMERGEREEVQGILGSVDPTAQHAHAATFLLPDPDRDRYLGLMRRVLGVYKDPVVAASVGHHELVPDELVDGGQHTLYLTAPEEDQARFRALGAAIVRQVLSAAYRRSNAAAGPLQPPLLLVLDQVVGVAPIDDLTNVASTGAARGVQVVSVFQDLAQIEGHYGADASLLIKNHRAKLVLPSAHDADPRADRQHLLPQRYRDELRDGEGALLYGTMRPVRVKLRPWYRDRRLRRRVETPQDALAPAERRDPATSYLGGEETRAWLRRSAPARPDVVDDSTIPVDASSTEVFGSLDDDTRPQNVTPLSDARRRFRRP